MINMRKPKYSLGIERISMQKLFQIPFYCAKASFFIVESS
ncbi:hypothetical protein T11_6554 [Trichinella zimbabwensis]|uniref:Uncharacterized protein n=1 Tax=Trichinella zimbabwensis TaxID=268475 RepID=A0A0V1GCK1_9BILA|nr:hypothetical protein T11_9383 [Trichinella zimbabwensis]KRY95949.1 hypothetical protein T11_6554 [Trichinella zimbabwensis]